MKIDFPLPTDGKMHRFCMQCGAEGVLQEQTKAGTKYPCPGCGHVGERTIYFDKHKCWLDKDKELWHESAGVFLRNKQGKYLFFQRTEYPLSLTVPTGHVDKGEEPELAAKRELKEEVSIVVPSLHYLGQEDVWGDSCSSGADVHRWHAYCAQLDSNPKVIVKEEGEKPVWLTLDEAKKSDLAYVVNQMVLRYEEELAKWER
jgi:8-oxo-dGTP pyrophosphatase MutT (NUDIX family)/DNA-directed RNA polymerase subunit RPC12/RpoP